MPQCNTLLIRTGPSTWAWRLYSRWQWRPQVSASWCHCVVQISYTKLDTRSKRDISPNHSINQSRCQPSGRLCQSSTRRCSKFQLQRTVMACVPFQRSIQQQHTGGCNLKAFSPQCALGTHPCDRSLHVALEAKKQAGRQSKTRLHRDLHGPFLAVLPPVLKPTTLHCIWHCWPSTGFAFPPQTTGL